jgi:hypothetical protein
MKNTIIRFLILSLALWLGACATSHNSAGQEVVDHSFGFNVDKDSPSAELIDYRYGNSKDVGTSNRESRRREGTSNQRASMSGLMVRGDTLYVKWRIKDSGIEYEDTVDLKSRLPRSIKDQRIYFIIDGSQLYVYLISLFPVREEAYTVEDAEKIYDGMKTPHQQAFRGRLRNSVVMIYPENKKLYPINSK